jgi:hypothetical protein
VPIDELPPFQDPFSLPRPALAPVDPACYGISFACPLSPTGGRQYTAALAELTRRIRAALDAGKARPSP